MDPEPLYLLDTKILVHYVRGDEVWARVRAGYDLFNRNPKPVLSIVTAGELRSIAIQRRWGDAKRGQVEFCLSYFRQLPIDTDSLVNTYATFDAELKASGHRLGKNDLWIAATAFGLNARLLTTDRDFDPLDGVFIARDWIDPSGV